MPCSLETLLRGSRYSKLWDKVCEDSAIIFTSMNIVLPSDSLAYLTAATHGLEEEAGAIAESLSTRLDKVCLYVCTCCVYMYCAVIVLCCDCTVL